MHNSIVRLVRTQFNVVALIVIVSFFLSACSKTATEPGAPFRGVLTGTIYDADTQSPLPDVTVSLFDGKNSGITDRNGKFEIDSIPIGADKITVATARYITFTDTVEIVTDRITTFSAYLLPSFKGWITAWQSVQSGTSQNLTNACFADAATIYACGFAGTLLRSVDTGKTWSAITLPTSENLYCVNFFNRQTGIVMGNKGTNLRTTDGGATWTSASGNQYDFRNASFSNSTSGMAVGGDGAGGPAILVTNDGGITWTDRSVKLENSVGMASTGLYSVWRMGQICYIGNSTGTVYKSTTEGISWSIIDDRLRWCRSISFIDLANGTHVGANGDIENTTDGGLTWTTQIAGPGGTYSGISRSDARHATIVGDNGTILHSRTSGSSWINQSFTTSRTLYNSAFADSVHGVVVGENGTILLPVTQ